MRIIYILISLAIFFLEMVVYEWSYRLGEFWHAHKASYGSRGDLCENVDSIGNCLDFPWHALVSGIGLFAVKIIVLIIFLMVLLKKKKMSTALLIALPYILLILSFHFDLLPIKRLENLSDWLEMANLGGILSAGILLLIILFTSVIYFYENNNTNIR